MNLCVSAVVLALHVAAASWANPAPPAPSTLPSSLGLDAGILAASGVDVEGVGDLLARLESEVDALAQLSAATAAYSEACLALEAARSADVETASAEAAVGTAIGAVALVVDNLWLVVASELSPSVAERLATCREAHQRAVPAFFKVVPREDDDWSAIELALVEERRAARLGVALSAESAQLLAGVRSEPEVIAATLAWETWHGPIEDVLAHLQSEP